MHDQHLEHGNLLGWLSYALGTFLMWLQHNGLGVLGAASIVFGMWLQWKTYKLRERELLLKRLERAWADQ